MQHLSQLTDAAVERALADVQTIAVDPGTSIPDKLAALGTILSSARGLAETLLAELRAQGTTGHEEGGPIHYQNRFAVPGCNCEACKEIRANDPKGA